VGKRRRLTARERKLALSNEQRANAAAEQVRGFENERYGHELNLARLGAVEEDKRDDSWKDAVQNSLKAIDTIDTAIASTKEAQKAAKDGNPVVDVDAMRTALEEKVKKDEAETPEV
jgi:hypothetical protein